MTRAFTHLSELLDRSAARKPEAMAIEDEACNQLSFAALLNSADRLTTRLARWGISRGDRVGMFLPKSIESVASIHGILRSGAAYVPVDPLAPSVRGAGILADARVRAAVIDASSLESLRAAWPADQPEPRWVTVGPDSVSNHSCAWNEIQSDQAPSPLPPPRDPDDLAYVLYTSGSTGRPKGVMLTHRAAFTFLDWCESALGLRDSDRFASHAPFHFDLSVFDLFASCRRAAPVVLVGESLGKDPERLAAFLADRRISVWYSAPSILVLLCDYALRSGRVLHSPRLVLFAGEVFPARPLRTLRRLWPTADLWNLYGPTETNVCTAYEVPTELDNSDETLPIGRVCPPLESRVVDELGRDLPTGALGELVIRGPGLMRGYFGRPELTARAFFRVAGEAWYRTGDLVADDGYHFHGRRDRMVKKRGYRIELGEIEAAFDAHEDVVKAAVLAHRDAAALSIHAFLSLRSQCRGSIIAFKRHCATLLPAYMIPDSIHFLPDLPQTSTGKIDYPALAQLVDPPAEAGVTSSRDRAGAA
jgi:amino acid adenylation domain-containing protein